MRFTAAALAAFLLASDAVAAQVAPPPGSTAQPPPATQAPAPGAPAPGGVAPVALTPVVPPVPLGARVFTAKSGLIFNTVRPDRVVDFEMVIGYLQAAFEKTTDARVREQAKGWRVFKATEPAPNNTVLYVFVIDPAVPGADYGLGRILADAYPDQIDKIWSLYTGSLAPSASLINLTPVQPAPPPAVPLTPAVPVNPPVPVNPAAPVNPPVPVNPGLP